MTDINLLVSRIEALRTKLNDLIAANTKEGLLNEEIIRVSQELDELLNEYHKASHGKK